MIPALLLAVAAVPQDPPAPPPNVVLIVADDLGWGDVGAFGQERLETPNVDRLAAEGLRFTRFYAGSTVCAPSRCCLMTGLHTGHARVRGNARLPLEPEDVTVAELLREHGYATGLSGKWGLGEAGSTGVPTRQGFDHFFGYLNQRHAHNYYPTFLVANERRVPLPNRVPDEDATGAGEADVKRVYSHDLITADALDFVTRHRDRPFFLYLAYTIPHANNEAGRRGMEAPEPAPWADPDWPAPERGMAAMVWRLDRDVGRILDHLEALGLDEDTLVLFTSDNGPHREGGHDPDFFDSNGPLRGIKRDLYEGGIRVPTIARWPGRVRAGGAVETPYAFWDVLPTLVELAGGTPPEGIDGVSFAHEIVGAERASPERFLYWEFHERGGAQAVMERDWKLVRRFRAGVDELYDVRADPGETRDLAAERPAVVERLRGALADARTPSERWTLPAFDPAEDGR